MLEDRDCSMVAVVVALAVLDNTMTPIFEIYFVTKNTKFLYIIRSIRILSKPVAQTADSDCRNRVLNKIIFYFKKQNSLSINVCLMQN